MNLTPFLRQYVVLAMHHDGGTVTLLRQAALSVLLNSYGARIWQGSSHSEKRGKGRSPGNRNSPVALRITSKLHA
jgi:hypothetical protein